MKNNYRDIAIQIASLVEAKNLAYGDSFAKSGDILKILYPHHIPIDAYGNLLAITRVIDKLFRVATHEKYNGESPWMDICGYALLAVCREVHSVPRLSKKRQRG